MDKFVIAKERISINNILLHFGIHIKRGGFICCPKHKEKNPSCKVYDKNVKCFACGFFGSVIDITMVVLDCDKYDALSYLDTAFSLELNTPLTIAQKKEWALQKRKKENETKIQKRLESFEKETTAKIIDKFRKCEKWLCDNKCEDCNDLETWHNKIGDRYFEIIDMAIFLKWLYLKICDISQPESKYDYIYNIDKVELLRKIYIGEIKI